MSDNESNSCTIPLIIMIVASMSSAILTAILKDTGTAGIGGAACGSACCAGLLYFICGRSKTAGKVLAYISIALSVINAIFQIVKKVRGKDEEERVSKITSV